MSTKRYRLKSPNLVIVMVWLSNAKGAVAITKRQDTMRAFYIIEIKT